MIVSFIEGRIRLRHPILRDEDISQQIISVLKAQNGINEINFNNRTGSILIEYDSAAISKEELLAVYQLFENQFLTQQDQSSESEPVMDEEEALVVQKLELILTQAKTALKKDSSFLLIMLLTSSMSGYFGLKKWHTLIASVFVLSCVKHFNNKNARSKNGWNIL